MFLRDSFPRQIWALIVVLLLGSGPPAFESALLCTFRHFLELSVAFGTLKVIEAFAHAPLM